MTILVLELKIPELADRRSIAELRIALGHSLPTFVSWLLSFVVLGMFWYRHNHQYRHYQRITRGMLALHFVQLAAAAFFPFCAALFGRYPFNPLAGTIYVACIFAYALASLANWTIAERSGSMIADITPMEFKRSRNGLLRGCVVIAALFAFYLSEVLAK